MSRGLGDPPSARMIGGYSDAREEVYIHSLTSGERSSSARDLQKVIHTNGRMEAFGLPSSSSRSDSVLDLYYLLQQH